MSSFVNILLYLEGRLKNPMSSWRKIGFPSKFRVPYSLLESTRNDVNMKHILMFWTCSYLDAKRQRRNAVMRHLSRLALDFLMKCTKSYRLPRCSLTYVSIFPIEFEFKSCEIEE
jgi:hypothetical protein